MSGSTLRGSQRPSPSASGTATSTLGAAHPPADGAESLQRQKFQRARLAADLGKWPAAITLLEECLEEVPDHADALGLYGLCLARLGRDLDRACEACRRAVETHPFDAQLHTYMGCVYLAMGMRLRAESCFHTALRLDPHDTLAARGLAIASRPQRGGGILMALLGV